MSQFPVTLHINFCVELNFNCFFVAFGESVTIEFETFKEENMGAK